MVDNLSQDPSLFGTVGQSLSDQASLFLGDPLLERLPSLHQGMGKSPFAVDIHPNGLRTQETGLEAWMQHMREQWFAKTADQFSQFDSVTGQYPSVSTSTYSTGSEGMASAPSEASDEESFFPLNGTAETVAHGHGWEIRGTPEVIRLEAEAMAVSGGYRTEQQSFASGEGLIRIQQRGSDHGIISSVFEGGSGTYAVIVGYYDEADGESAMSLDIGDQRLDWHLDGTTQRSQRKVSEQTFVRRVLSHGMAIETGAELRLTGLRDRGEMAAVDYIELVPIDPTVPLPFRVEAEEMEPAILNLKCSARYRN